MSEKKISKSNLGDKYNHRVTLRLNDSQHEFLIDISNLLGVSPSDYVRMMINASLSAAKNDEAYNSLTKGKGGNDENVKTDINNIV